MQFNAYYLSLLSVFLIVGYMIAVDQNVAKFIVLMWKFAQVNFHRGVFWIKFYPRLRYDTAILKWRSRSILKKQLKNPPPPPEEMYNDTTQN